MPFIQWTSKIAINIPLVDEQHQKLFDLLNRLHDSVTAGKEKSELLAILDELVDYTVYHFDTEEELFQKYNFPMYELHKKEHNRLTVEAVKLQRDVRNGSATVSFEVLDFLYDWLTDHTSGLDLEFANYLRANNIEVS